MKKLYPHSIRYKSGGHVYEVEVTEAVEKKWKKYIKTIPPNMHGKRVPDFEDYMNFDIEVLGGKQFVVESTPETDRLAHEMAVAFHQAQSSSKDKKINLVKMFTNKFLKRIFK